VGVRAIQLQERYGTYVKELQAHAEQFKLH